MTFVALSQRQATLERIGISLALRRVASGEELHPALWYRCKGPPFLADHGATAPPGTPILPLWDCGDMVTGLREAQSGLEFVNFHVEAPEDCLVLSRSEQGLWATVFVDLIEDSPESGKAEFAEAALAVGFKFLPLVFQSYEAADHRTYAAHQAFLRDLVSAIDSQALG